jgi:hypothetical protein
MIYVGKRIENIKRSAKVVPLYAARIEDLRPG